MRVPKHVKDAAVSHWIANQGSLEESSSAYGISRATLSRELQDRKLRDTYLNYKSVEESKMLTYLSSKNIKDLSTLRQHV